MKLFKMSLTSQMIFATLLGVFVGLFFGDLCEVFAPWGQAYIMLLKVTIIPYLFCAIIHGVGMLHAGQALEILKKGILFIAIAWVINIFMIYLTAFSFPHAKGVHFGSFTGQESISLNFAELLIPENIFYALSNNIVPAIVIFCLLVGIALIHLKEKQTLMGVFSTFVDALTRITIWISRITPIGTFVIIAYQVGTTEISIMKQMSSYIILYVLTLLIITFWIFPRLASMLTSLTFYQWLKDLLPILLLAYTTNTVIVCLPYIIQLLSRETKKYFPNEEKAESQSQGIVSIVFNLPFSTLFITVFIFFVSILYNIPLSLLAQGQLFVATFITSLGAVSLGSWINNLTFLLDSLSLPLDAVHLYIATLPFISGFQAMLSAMEITTVSLFITLACRKLLTLDWSKIIRGAVITAIPVFLIFAFVKVVPILPPIESIGKTICDLEMQSDVKVRILTDVTRASSSLSREDTFDRILRTKKLRVGYNPNVIPFCFYNSHRQLVGFDIAFAYELANDLGCDLEFVPMSYGKVTQELQSNLYDIAMSALSISEERLKGLYFTTPYVTAQLVFLVEDTQRKQFPNLSSILRSSSVRIAIMKGSSLITQARTLFPDKEIVLVENYEAFAANPEVADVALWEEQEAISWVLRHPRFLVIYPKPSLGVDRLAYAINPSANRFLAYLDQWLQLKDQDGFTKKQYDRWVLGKSESSITPERRWSILQDVLHLAK